MSAQRPNTVCQEQPEPREGQLYGTFNLLIGKVIMIRSKIMNSSGTAKHLEAVLAACPEEPLPFLWARAKWYGGEAVRQILAANPRLEVIKLPSLADDFET